MDAAQLRSHGTHNCATTGGNSTTIWSGILNSSLSPRFRTCQIRWGSFLVDYRPSSFLAKLAQGALISLLPDKPSLRAVQRLTSLGTLAEVFIDKRQIKPCGRLITRVKLARFFECRQRVLRSSSTIKSTT
jgi:hypothetical protein